MGADRTERPAGRRDLVTARSAAQSVATFWKTPGPDLLEPALRTNAEVGPSFACPVYPINTFVSVLSDPG